jgi:hypothetical protein
MPRKQTEFFRRPAETIEISWWFNLLWADQHALRWYIKNERAKIRPEATLQVQI